MKIKYMQVSILLLTLLFISCEYLNKIGVYFEVINNSNHTMENIQISTKNNEAKNNIKVIKSKETGNIFLDMINISKTDGCYKIKYSTSTSDTEQIFGYYTNGYPVDEKIIIEIENDTALKIKYILD